MKKVINIIIVLMIGFLFTNVVHAANVTVKEITIDSKSDTIEVNSFSYEGLNIKTDIYFNQVNDYVKYKVILKNNDNKDYTLQDLKSNFKNDYTSVTYEYENNNREFKANSEKVIFITFKYTKQAESLSDINGTNIVITVPFETLTNPKTGVYNIVSIMIWLVLISLSVYFLISKKAYTLGVFIIVGLFATNLYLINAAETLNLDLSFTTNADAEGTKKAIFKDGNTINDYLYDIAEGECEINYPIPPDRGENSRLQGQQLQGEMSGGNFCGEKILRSETIPNDKKVDENIVSTDESDIPIYMWYEESTKTVKYYSEAKMLYLNEDASNMFTELFNLTQIDLETIRTRNTTNMGNLFSGDFNIKELNLTNFNTSKVTDMAFIFGGCSGLESLDLSNFDFSSIDYNSNGLETILSNSLQSIKTPRVIPNNESFKIVLPNVYSNNGNYYTNIDKNTPSNSILLKENNFIKFTIHSTEENNDKDYIAPKNMTLGEWLNSKYNTDHINVSNYTEESNSEDGLYYLYDTNYDEYMSYDFYLNNNTDYQIKPFSSNNQSIN